LASGPGFFQEGEWIHGVGSVGWGCGGRHVISRVIGRLGGGWRGRVGDATDGRGCS
jgi:hypothetical protein